MSVDLGVVIPGSGSGPSGGEALIPIRDRGPSRIDSAASRSLAPYSKCQIAQIAGKCIWSSRIVRCIVFSVVASVLIAHFVSPESWILALVVIGSLAGSYGISLTTARGQFELSAIRRLCKRRNYNEITIPGLPARIFLGALPNQLTNDLSKLEAEGVQAVLSVNESWERSPCSVSVPYTDRAWESANMVYQQIDVQDHTFLSPQQLDEAANFINSCLDAGKNVYVHCRAGQGRSSAVIAAGGMKKGKSIEEVCSAIIQGRPNATIWNKIPSLVAYRDYLSDQSEDGVAQVSPAARAIFTAHQAGDRREVKRLTAQLKAANP